MSKNMNWKGNALIFTASAFSSLAIASVLLIVYDFVQNPILLNMTALLSTVLFIYPLRFIYQNSESLETSLNSFVKENYGNIKWVVPVFLVSSGFFYFGFSNPVIDVLNLSFGITARLFAGLKYLQGPVAWFGEFLYGFTRVYIHLVWSYTVTGIGLSTFEGLRDIFS